jgi:hypothetical protein
MPVSPNHRAKLLYLMKALLEKTDEEHPMTVNDLIDELAEHGISAERKAIYSDMDVLTLFGLDIVKRRAKSAEYHIASRMFELPELKLLVDAVQSSRFITEKKSAELIAKLSTLTSVAQAKELKRQIHLSGRAKSFNEQAYYLWMPFTTPSMTARRFRSNTLITMFTRTGFTARTALYTRSRLLLFYGTTTDTT